MKKILVTGVNGFIGRHVVGVLANEGVGIIGTSLEPELLPQLKRFPIDYRPFDMNDSAADATRVFGCPDVLIHLAWPGLDNFKDDRHCSEYMPTSYRFVESLVRGGVRNINVVGTCLEYGMREGCLNEAMVCAPVTSYGLAKNKLRMKLDELSREHSFCFKWARLFYLYGEGQSRKALLEQLKRAVENNDPEFKMSGGKQSRDYLPVEDVARYLVRIALQEKVTGVVNCCSGQAVMVRDLVERQLKNMNRAITLNLGVYPYPDYEPMAFWGDNAKLQRILEGANES